jgi:hypothetical protein
VRGDPLQHSYSYCDCESKPDITMAIMLREIHRRLCTNDVSLAWIRVATHMHLSSFMHAFQLFLQDVCQLVINRLYSTVHMTIIIYVHTFGGGES